MNFRTVRETMKGAAKRILALVLSLCLLIPGFCIPSLAADTTGKPMKNTYLLRVDTGAVGGDSVLYFGIRYRDKDGIERCEFILPHNGSPEDTRKIAVSVGDYESRMESVRDMFGYDVTATGVLGENGHDEFLIQPFYTVSEILSVDVYQYYRSGKKGWSCTGLELFEVNTLYGLDMAGYYSAFSYVDFEGKLLWYLDDTTDFTMTQSDKIYSLSASAQKSGTGFRNLVDGKEKPFSTHEESEYLFEIDIADVSDAGIEALESPYSDDSETVSDMTIPELMLLEITYLEKLGSVRTVYMPVITSSVAFALDHWFINKNKDRLAGLVQQGGQLLFSGKLPSMEKIEKCRLIYSTEAADMAGLVHEKPFAGDTPDGNDLSILYPELSDDRLSLSSVRIYRHENDIRRCVTYLGNETMLQYGVSSKPLYFYCTDTENGTVVSPDTPKTLVLSEYDGRAKTSPTPDLSSRYLVTIETDTVPSAATTDDIEVYFIYQSKDGSENHIKTVNLREAIRNNYGFWPGKNGDYAYQYAVSAGGTAQFWIDIPDVIEITAAGFSMDSRSHDDWQMRSITVEKLTEIGPRSIEWANTACNGNASDRLISREFKTSAVMCTYRTDDSHSPVYISGEDVDSGKKEIHFDQNAKEAESRDIDWSDIRYSMTYKQAKQDLGFTKVRATYQVDVKVAGNEKGASENGDTGSENLFYFQLVFENGSSGFVLANQQLTADGFRAGEIESFVVKTNQDYGELVSIRILPDDTSETVNRTIFDKLKIDTITVTKKENSSISNSWRIDNIGWIEIDYRDDGAKNTLSGQPGRSAEEIVRDFPVTTSGYSTNLLFVISTAPYTKNDTPVYSSDALMNPQFEGRVLASIEYTTQDDPISRHTNIDVIAKMAEYSGKEARYAENDTFKDDEGNTQKCALADPAYMLRGGHEDRFFVTLQGVKEIQSITLRVKGENATIWRINSISVYEVTGDGKLLLNTQDEYQRHYPEQLNRITSSTEDSYKIIVTSDGSEQKQDIDFAPNKIEIQKDKTGWNSVITREPVSKNDTVNIFVHSLRNGISTDISDYDLSAVLEYRSKEDDSPNTVSIPAMQKSEDEGMFYEMGLNVTGLANVLSLTVSAQSANAVNAYIDYAIVQHVRSGVVIGTYYLNYSGKNAENPQRKAPDSDSMSKLPEAKQRIRLFFDEMTQESKLIPETNDILVAVNYRTTNDVSDKIYTSKYQYLTDVMDENGNQKYTQITPGMIAELIFAEPFVREITGITLVSVGADIHAVVNAAAAEQCSVSNGKETQEHWYGFTEKQLLSAVPKTTLPDDTVNVVPVTVELETAQSRETIDSGTNDPIRMVINYTTLNNELPQVMVFDDIREYLTDGSFLAGQTATIAFFMKDVGQIRSVSFEPYNEDVYGKASWGLSRLRFNMNGEKPAVIERTLEDPMIMEAAPRTIILSNIVVSTITSYHNSKVDRDNAVHSDAKGESRILLYSGDIATIFVEIDGSLPEYGFTVDAVLDRNGATTAVDCCERVGSAITFDPGENTTGEDLIYRITIASEEAPDVKAVVEFCVESGPGVFPKETDTEPIETEPVETEPVETEPVETEPVETEPVETEPVETEPVETEPIETESVGTEPIESQPVLSGSSDSETEPAGPEEQTGE